MSGCVFCRIFAGELPASTVYEDERVVAFLDIHPLRPGHTLVVPRSHATFLSAVPMEVQTHLWLTGQRLQATLRQVMPADAVHLLVNDGPAAFQAVPHVHLHLVPRRRGGPVRFLGRLLRHPRAPKLGGPRRETLDDLAARIRAAL